MYCIGFHHNCRYGMISCWQVQRDCGVSEKTEKEMRNKIESLKLTDYVLHPLVMPLQQYYFQIQVSIHSMHICHLFISACLYYSHSNITQQPLVRKHDYIYILSKTSLPLTTIIVNSKNSNKSTKIPVLSPSLQDSSQCVDESGDLTVLLSRASSRA
ncbi:hypothetical protein Ac2012v2_002817 [Leucoagaricus gongylophorus]